MEMDYADLIDSAANFSNGLDLTTFDEPSGSPSFSRLGDIDHSDVLEIEYEDKRTDSPSIDDNFNTCPYIPAASPPQAIQSPPMSPPKMTTSTVSNLASSPAIMTIIPIGWRRPKKISGLKDSPSRRATPSRQLSLENSTSSRHSSSPHPPSYANPSRCTSLPYHPMIFHPTSREEVQDREIIFTSESSKVQTLNQPKTALQSKNHGPAASASTTYRGPKTSSAPINFDQTQPRSIKKKKFKIMHCNICNKAFKVATGYMKRRYFEHVDKCRGRTGLSMVQAPTSASHSRPGNINEAPARPRVSTMPAATAVSSSLSSVSTTNAAPNSRPEDINKATTHPGSSTVSATTTAPSSSLDNSNEVPTIPTDETPSQRYDRKFCQRLRSEQKDLKDVFGRGLEENFSSIERTKEFFNRIIDFSFKKVQTYGIQLFQDEITE